MTKLFSGVAISRQDGSDQDGIHLLWSPPSMAGYSVDGFDIQRRVSRTEQRKDCYTFSPSELATLHSRFRLTYPGGVLSVREAACPTFPKDTPDEPFEPRPPKICIDFTKMPAATFPNPRVVEGVEFRVFGNKRRLSSRRDPLLPLTEQVTWKGHHGLNGGYKTEIYLPEGVQSVSFELVFFSPIGGIRVLDGNGKVLHTEETKHEEGKVKSFKYGFPGMARIEIIAPKNEWLFLNLCFHLQTAGCVRLNRAQPGPYPNPYRHLGYSFKVFDKDGKPEKQSQIGTWSGRFGLNAGYETEIDLPSPLTEVEVILVHGAKPPIVIARDETGEELCKEETGLPPGRIGVVRLAGNERIASIVVKAPDNETLILSVCPGKQQIQVDDDNGIASIPIQPDPQLAAVFAPPLANTINSTVGLVASQPVAVNLPHRCVAYTIDFNVPHTCVEINITLPGLLAIAFREGKAVQVETRSGAVSHFISFEGKVVDRVVIYCATAIRALTICVDIPFTEKEEEKDWAGVPFIVRGLQMPFTSVNPTLSNSGDEDNLAFSRLTASESLNLDGFHQASKVMNPAGNKANEASPLEYFTLTREQASDPFIDVHTWPYGLGSILQNTMRRVFGFGYLDKGGGLTPMESYDYRVSGYFRRRDIEETLLGFRTIPKSTLLPPGFRLDNVFFNTYKRTEVSLFPGGTPSGLLVGGTRKGIQLVPASAGGRCLKIKFEAPVTSVVLEIEPGTASNLSYKAGTSIYFPFLPGSIFSDPVPLTDSRVLLTFSDPIDELELFGSVFFYGVRLDPIGDTATANQIVKKTFILPGVRYEPTAGPVRPNFLGTQNLQQPAVVGNPDAAVNNPKEDMGFLLSWIPPSSGGGPVPWPEDIAAFPPFDMLGFHIERRRVDVPSSYKPIDEEDTLFMGSRSSRYELPPIAYGTDLLAMFAKASQPEPPVSPWMEAHDVLHSAAQKDGVPGALYQYKIFSVDAIGRRSSTGTLGSIVRLEKRLAPPQPVAPKTPVPDGVQRPAGLRTFVLQASDPNISAAGQALLGASTNAVVLEWGWHDEQREMDPFATEFRVYWQSVPPDRVEGQLIGAANFVGGLFEMSAQLNQSVQANVFTGRYITAGGYPFKIYSHTAGQNITISFEPSVLDSSQVPGTGFFRMSPVLKGDEQRPNKWEERTAVVPITAAKNYQYIFRDVLTLDATHPTANVWVGVSSSDDQSYVPDELPAAVLNGGRVGNESSIATTQAQARYYGKPVFTVPPPLADVPEILTKEPVGGSVSRSLNLPGLFAGTITVPGGHKVVLEQLPVSAITIYLGTNDDDEIEVTFPGQSPSTYTLGNPDDQTDFLAQIRSGEPSSIEGRFIMDYFIRFRSQFTLLWSRSIPDPIPYATQSVTFSSEPERFIFRVRLVDQAGHVSDNAAILPSFVRVISLRPPKAPELEASNSLTDTIIVKTVSREQFDLANMVLFVETADISESLDRTTLERAQLLRLPNRLDLYPDDGLRLRLKDGTIVSPHISSDLTGGTLEEGLRTIEFNLVLDYDQRAAVWAVLMSRDGIPSRVNGPVVVTTGPEPLVEPTLSSIRTGNEDVLSWTALPVPAKLYVERSLDGGVLWERVSPWLPNGTSGFKVLSPNANRAYRLVLQDQRNQTLTGTTLNLLPS